MSVKAVTCIVSYLSPQSEVKPLYFSLIYALKSNLYLLIGQHSMYRPKVILHESPDFVRSTIA